MGCAALCSVLPPRARGEAAGDASPRPAERPRKGRRGKGSDDSDGAVPEDHAGGAGGGRAGILRWGSAAPVPADDASAPRPTLETTTRVKFANTVEGALGKVAEGAK